MELRLDWLVGLAWIAAILPIVIASLPWSRLKSFHQLLLGFAGRGKTGQPSSHRFTIPQKFFLHFYVWAAVWTTFLLVIAWHYAYKIATLASDSSRYPPAASHLSGGSHVLSVHKSHFLTANQRHKVWQSVYLLLLMETQVLMRLYETVYVFKYSSSAQMHICGYLAGLYFYTLAPLSLCHFWVLRTLHFAARQVAEVESHGIDFNWQAYFEPIMKYGWYRWAGAAIFAWGWMHQRRCHAILTPDEDVEFLMSYGQGSLRKHREQSNQYAIPRGDWFEIVSSAHYLAEIVIYFGILVASGGTDFNIWLLLLFVVANLGFAAAETHRWYLQKFEDYPRKRWAIFPFVY